MAGSRSTAFSREVVSPSLLQNIDYNKPISPAVRLLVPSEFLPSECCGVCCHPAAKSSPKRTKRMCRRLSYIIITSQLAQLFV